MKRSKCTSVYQVVQMAIWLAISQEAHDMHFEKYVIRRPRLIRWYFWKHCRG